MKIPDKDVIEVEAYFTWMDENGFARTVAKPNIDIQLHHAQENTKAVTKLPGDHKFPIIIDARNVKSMTKEARDHFSLNRRSSRTTAFAIIIGSPVSRIIANFFIGLNNPRVPVRLFNKEEDALDWCFKIQEKLENNG